MTEMMDVIARLLKADLSWETNRGMLAARFDEIVPRRRHVDDGEYVSTETHRLARLAITNQLLGIADRPVSTYKELTVPEAAALKILFNMGDMRAKLIAAYEKAIKEIEDESKRKAAHGESLATDD